jgi:hypothetical protein
MADPFFADSQSLEESSSRADPLTLQEDTGKKCHRMCSTDDLLNGKQAIADRQLRTETNRGLFLISLSEFFIMEKVSFSFFATFAVWDHSMIRWILRIVPIRDSEMPVRLIRRFPGMAGTTTQLSHTQIE